MAAPYASFTRQVFTAIIALASGTTEPGDVEGEEVGRVGAEEVGRLMEIK